MPHVRNSRGITQTHGHDQRRAKNSPQRLTNQLFVAPTVAIINEKRKQSWFHETLFNLKRGITLAHGMHVYIRNIQTILVSVIALIFTLFPHLMVFISRLLYIFALLNTNSKMYLNNN